MEGLRLIDQKVILILNICQHLCDSSVLPSLSHWNIKNV